MVLPRLKGENHGNKEIFCELEAKTSRYRGREWFESKEDTIEFAEHY